MEEHEARVKALDAAIRLCDEDPNWNVRDLLFGLARSFLTGQWDAILRGEQPNA